MNGSTNLACSDNSKKIKCFFFPDEHFLSCQICGPCVQTQNVFANFNLDNGLSTTKLSWTNHCKLL